MSRKARGKRRPCEACKGAGWVFVDMNAEDVYAGLKGNGKDGMITMSAEHPCQACGGKGRGVTRHYVWRSGGIYAHVMLDEDAGEDRG